MITEMKKTSAQQRRREHDAAAVGEAQKLFVDTLKQADESTWPHGVAEAIANALIDVAVQKGLHLSDIETIGDEIARAGWLAQRD